MGKGKSEYKREEAKGSDRKDQLGLGSDPAVAACQDPKVDFALSETAAKRSGQKTSWKAAHVLSASEGWLEGL